MSQTDADRLQQLLRAGHPCVLIQTFEEDYAGEVVRAQALEAQRHILSWSVTSGLSDGVLKDDHRIPDTAHPAGALTHLAQHTPAKTVLIFHDLCPHLRDDRTLRCFRELVKHVKDVDSVILLIDASDDIPSAVRAAAAKLELAYPDAVEIESIIRITLKEIHARQSITVQLRRADLDVIIRNLQGLTRSQVRQAISEMTTDDRTLDASDLKRLISYKKRALRDIGVLEPVETFVALDEIGGLKVLKEWLELRAQALSDEAIAFGVEPPRGMLMLGVQGTGKSLSAKAVATAWSRPLVRLDIGALFDRYIGETERRLRDALKQAEMMSPVVLWIDEIEKAFASAAAQSVDGGLSKRMFGSLLTWMQEHGRPVFVIATANDVSALPPELLRKGRFDEIFFIDLPGKEARKDVFRIHLKKRQRDPEHFDLDQLAAASENFSGAEIEQAIKAAIYTAFARSCLLSTQMIVDAMRASPSLAVTMKERIDALRAWAAGRCVRVE